MSFTALETSAQQGAPVELYEWRMAPSAGFGNAVFGFTPTRLLPSGTIPDSTFDHEVPPAGSHATDPSGVWTFEQGSVVGQTVGYVYAATLARMQGRWGGGLGDPSGAWTFRSTFVGTIGHRYRVTYGGAKSSTAEINPDLPYTEVLTASSAGLQVVGGVNTEAGGTLEPFTAVWDCTALKPSITVDVGFFDLSPDVRKPIYTFEPGTFVVEDMGLAEDASACEVVSYQTSADKPITYNATLYSKYKIRRGNVRQGQDGPAKAELDVQLSFDNPVAPLFLTGDLPIAPVTCTIRQLHRGDLTDARVPFIAEVVRSRMEKDQLVLTLAPADRQTEARIPRTLMQPGCNNFLGDAVCRVPLAAYTLNSTVTAISDDGRTVTVDGLAAFAGDDTTFFIPGAFSTPTCRKMAIRGQAGDTVTLERAIPDLTVGDAVAVTAGCDRKNPTCHNRFGNLRNRRAFDLVPIQNPWVGGAGLG